MDEKVPVLEFLQVFEVFRKDCFSVLGQLMEEKAELILHKSFRAPFLLALV